MAAIHFVIGAVSVMSNGLQTFIIIVNFIMTGLIFLFFVVGGNHDPK